MTSSPFACRPIFSRGQLNCLDQLGFSACQIRPPSMLGSESFRVVATHDWHLLEGMWLCCRLDAHFLVFTKMCWTELIRSFTKVARSNLRLCRLELCLSSIGPLCIWLMIALGAVKDARAWMEISSVFSLCPLVMLTYSLRCPTLISFSIK